MDELKRFEAYARQRAKMGSPLIKDNTELSHEQNSIIERVNKQYKLEAKCTSTKPQENP